VGACNAVPSVWVKPAFVVPPAHCKSGKDPEILEGRTTDLNADWLLYRTYRGVVKALLAQNQKPHVQFTRRLCPVQPWGFEITFVVLGARNSYASFLQPCSQAKNV